MTTNLTACLLACLLALQTGDLVGQEARSLPLIDGTLRIDGTSNKSDWTVEVTEMDGMLWLSESEAGFAPDSVYFVTRGGDMKSGVSVIMDRLMYKALKTDQHPDIVYTLGSTGISRASSDDTLRWQTTGSLWLAGEADTLSTIVTGVEEAPGRFVFTGSHRMSMREHGITPPTAMFGALHTSEWVEIVFRLVFGARPER
ncbi:MAG TPA: YceI family protein [Rhodothermales bacterium]|nr:YceI family protein [Rhodothermales bacterium]